MCCCLYVVAAVVMVEDPVNPCCISAEKRIRVVRFRGSIGLTWKLERYIPQVPSREAQMEPPKSKSSITRLPKLIDTPSFDRRYQTTNEFFIPGCDKVEEAEPGESADS